MILIGMFDSPFVRRVAVSMKLLGMDFEHRNWSVGRDQTQIRKYNPLGRTPTLMLADGETLIDSSAILDYLDERAGAERALLPRSGAARRRGLRLMSIATGAAEKAISQIYENVFRPAEKRHEPWVQRCREQTEGALAELDRACAALPKNDWLLGEQMSQADITVACAFTFIREAVSADAARFPALMALAARCEALPAFKVFHVPFFPPTPPR